MDRLVPARHPRTVTWLQRPGQCFASFDYREPQVHARCYNSLSMPVITCPDCGREVSTLATACPHCGRPSPSGFAPIAASAAPPATEETLWHGTPSWRVLIGKVGIMILTVIIIPIAAGFVASRAIDIEMSS